MTAGPVLGQAGWIEYDEVVSVTLGRQPVQQVEAVLHNHRVLARIIAIEGKVALHRLHGSNRSVAGRDGRRPAPESVERESAGVAEAVEHRPALAPGRQRQTIVALV